MSKNLVIVESPAKAKTIEKYLGPDYKVLASYGHVRDLLPKDGAVDPNANFAMQWVLGDNAGRALRPIEQAAKIAKTIYLATDPDREGEAISWHMQELLGQKKLLKDRDIYRVTFNAITKDTIKAAFAAPRQVNQELVDAYLARRALDYLVGFNLSPILWRKVPGSKSAGRVQSVALRLICDREMEIEKFRPQEYWTIAGQFTADGQNFWARLTHLDGKKLEKFTLGEKGAADAALAQLTGQNYHVREVASKAVKRNPPPPFITSSLQMAAARVLGMSASNTMRVAQRLYEGVNIGGETVGLITYMRTDGVTLSPEAIANCRSTIKKIFGEEYVAPYIRQYTSKAKNAQEAHEAIRPTDLGRTPEQVAKFVDSDMARLYQLIWQRTLAAQMAAAEFDQVSADIINPTGKHVFRATGSTLKFDGFLKLYREEEEDKAAASKGEVNEEGEDNKRLPILKAEQKLGEPKLDAEQHFTQPPPRYTEATLVKSLEELGIGRPSTYASIIQTLQSRNYVRLDKKRFFPEDRGRIVTTFLSNFFKKYVEYDFTAHLEEELDDVSGGRLDYHILLRKFWDAFAHNLDEVKPLTITQVIDALDAELETHLFPVTPENPEPRKCTNCADGRLGIKLGKFGAFVGCSNYPECNYTRRLGLDVEDIGEDGQPQGNQPREIGTDPETGAMISLKLGPYGLYVERAATDNHEIKRATLMKGTPAAQVDLDKALSLLALPRDIGVLPETGDKIKSNNGRFGPYVQAGKVFASIPKGEDALTIGLNRAVDLLMTKIANSQPLKVLGNHPETNEPIEIKKGRFGLQLVNGEIIVSLGKRGLDDIELAEALELIAKAPPPKKKKSFGKKAAAKKSAAKKPAIKKAATKAPAKKVATKAPAKKAASKAPTKQATVKK